MNKRRIRPRGLGAIVLSGRAAGLEKPAGVPGASTLADHVVTHRLKTAQTLHFGLPQTVSLQADRAVE
jgi:hypothetical protein